jgi:hypothetical protein
MTCKLASKVAAPIPKYCPVGAASFTSPPSRVHNDIWVTPAYLRVGTAAMSDQATRLVRNPADERVNPGVRVVVATPERTVTANRSAPIQAEYQCNHANVASRANRSCSAVKAARYARLHNIAVTGEEGRRAASRDEADADQPRG